MSIKNKNKDNLKDHGGVELVAPAVAPTSDDPLRFWTGHPTENFLVDLHEFADGASKDSNPNGAAQWGAFSGRRELITEVAPAVQARLTLATRNTCIGYLTSLRKFWRICVQLESTVGPHGTTLECLTSVRGVTQLHEAGMHRDKFDRKYFGIVLNIVNDTRRLMRLGALVWTSPKRNEPDRQLIPDAHAKALKIGIKRDWERVRKTWERNYAIRRGEEPDTLNEFEKQDYAVVQEYAERNAMLRKHWTYFERIQQSAGNQNPTTDQILNGRSKEALRGDGLYVSQMRAIAFPTAEETHIAFHSALVRSGWNPSTLITGIDATLPTSIFQHPKDSKQSVLSAEADVPEAGDNAEDFAELNMQGSKRRSGGRLQFCMGLKKDPDSPPNIVAAYLERTKELRAQLHEDVKEANVEYERLKAHDATKEAIERQFKRLQTLQQGTRNVWLYVDYRGAINWLDGSIWRRFVSPASTKRNGLCSYLELVTWRLNAQRQAHGEYPIAVVTPSDFRDIYARWVYIQTGGNIIAVMIALGHASLRSTDHYTDNNIFSAENDEAVRKFMTHLFDELAIGRLDLTILVQLVRHGPMTDEMLARLTEYRSLTRSRVKVACADVRNPPADVDPDHVEGKRCGTHRCLKECPHARFLPESLDGIAMRIEELMEISDHISLDAWIKGGFDKELEAGEYLLAECYTAEEVEKARTYWREKIFAGKHVVPGVGFVRQREAA